MFLEDEIENVFRRLRALRGEIDLSTLSIYSVGNSRSRMDTVPEEIFLKICHFTLAPLKGSTRTLYGSLFSNSVTEKEQKNRVKTLHILAGVCRSWRRITIKASSLWSYHSDCIRFERKDPEERFRTWIQRSGSCPLSVSIHIPTTVSIDASALIRLVNVRVAIQYAHDTEDQLSQVFPLEAPLLENVVVLAHRHAGLSINDLFAATPSQLRALALSYIAIPSSPVNFPSLTNLYLHNCAEGATLHGLLGLLSHSPNIQFLFFHRDLHPPLDYTSLEVPLPKVSMRSLRVVTFLESRWQFIFYMINSLSLPKNAHVHLRPRQSPGRNVGNVVPVVQLPYLTFYDVATRLHFQLTPYDMAMVIEGSQDPTDLSRPAGRLHTQHNDAYDYFRSTALPMVRELCVRLRGSRELNCNVFNTFLHLHQLPQLETLVLDVGLLGYSHDPVMRHVENLLDALVPPTGDLVCPALRSVVVILEIEETAGPRFFRNRWLTLLERSGHVKMREKRGCPLALKVKLWVPVVGSDMREGSIWRWDYDPVAPGALGEDAKTLLADSKAEDRATTSLVQWVEAAGQRNADRCNQKEPFLLEPFVLKEMDEATQYWGNAEILIQPWILDTM
ncbi:uncharacterized protein BXZ73DRAFT_80401 [Epithele typhae]|uniref:uncharacterized protein n=1 Tax=Epithele typhae TaxID=378194 RepID=UPI0020077FE1|nr:uncharacterized protein BXZ73DRAFT_80401 [Epithele typhae]KAH9919191.1 hypothetical protein BXZ73DRAFT_80401 [Epithele typhae]